VVGGGLTEGADECVAIIREVRCYQGLLQGKLAAERRFKVQQRLEGGVD